MPVLLQWQITLDRKAFLFVWYCWSGQTWFVRPHIFIYSWHLHIRINLSALVSSKTHYWLLLPYGMWLLNIQKQCSIRAIHCWILNKWHCEIGLKLVQPSAVTLNVFFSVNNFIVLIINSGSYRFCYINAIKCHWWKNPPVLFAAPKIATTLHQKQK